MKNAICLICLKPNDIWIEFLNKLREIPMMTLKYVATNQSLYV